LIPPRVALTSRRVQHVQKKVRLLETKHKPLEWGRIASGNAGGDSIDTTDRTDGELRPVRVLRPAAVNQVRELVHEA
jgi:hypothetical protein